jgi:integrase
MQNMARTIVDSNLKDRAARSRLAARGKPHYRLIEPGLHLGYRRPRGRKGKAAAGGTWVVRHYVGGQAYVTETIGVADDFSDADGVAVLDFRQAQNKAREIHVARAHGDAGMVGPLTVAAALDAYLEHLEGRGQSVVNQRHHADALIIPVLGDAEVAKLTTKQLSRWLHDLAKLPPRVRTQPGQPQQHREIDTDDPEAVRRRRSSANRVYNTLRAALNHVWRQGSVPSNAAWARVESFANVDAARVRALTVAESKRLINVCDAELRPLVVAALQSGCRYGELCRLLVGDFNPDSGTLAIWQSKSGKPRHVVLTREGADFFAQLAAGRDPGDPMLRRADGSAWGRSNQQHRMIDACRRAKITPPIGVHCLRHTWASLAIMAGMPLQVAARNLGHVDITMVQKHYGHLAQDYVTDAIREHAPKFGLVTSNVSVLR